MRPEYCWYGGWWGGMPMMTPIFLVILVVIILVILYGRGGSRPPWGGGSDQRQGHDAAEGASAIEILKRRYAGGEISREEFERIKKDLEA